MNGIFIALRSSDSVNYWTFVSLALIASPAACVINADTRLTFINAGSRTCPEMPFKERCQKHNGGRDTISIGAIANELNLSAPRLLI